MNRIDIMGRLVRDPELRYTTNEKAYTKFTVAVNKRTGNTDKAIYIDCVAWNGQAEYITNYIGKGNRVTVSGEIDIRDYTDRDGINRKVTEIIVKQIEAIDFKNNAVTESKEDEVDFSDFDDVEKEMVEFLNTDIDDIQF